MSHEHNHSHNHSHGESKNIAFAFFLNLFFCIIEIVGGLMTNSIAILSNALHDFGDSFALGLAWYFQQVSGRKPTSQYTYGYKRFSVLSAIINSVILLTGSIFVLYESVLRIVHPVSSNAKGILLFAILGVIVNGAAIFRLKKGNSMNERVVSLHLLEDVLGWFALLIGSIVMIFVNVPILDPILSVGISCYILFNVYKNLKSVFFVILQGKPENVNEQEIINRLKNLSEVKDIHDLHIWTMDSEYNILTVHLVLNKTTNFEEQSRLRTKVHEILKELHIEHSTIEIEYEGETCEWCE
jgi:cobalt-zinc-cadmium efflux system protein